MFFIFFVLGMMLVLSAIGVMRLYYAGYVPKILLGSASPPAIICLPPPTKTVVSTRVRLLAPTVATAHSVPAPTIIRRVLTRRQAKLV